METHNIYLLDVYFKYLFNITAPLISSKYNQTLSFIHTMGEKKLFNRLLILKTTWLCRLSLTLYIAVKMNLHSYSYIA